MGKKTSRTPRGWKMSLRSTELVDEGGTDGSMNRGTDRRMEEGSDEERCRYGRTR